MIADEAFDKLQAFLRTIDLEAVAVIPGHIALSGVIRAYQNAKPPDGPYALLTLQASVDLDEIDHFEYREATVTIPPNVSQARVIQKRARAVALQFSLDVFAKDAVNRANRLALALRSDAAPVPLYPFTVRDVRRIAHSGELAEQHWQGRAALVIEIAGIECSEFAIDTIESGTIDVQTKAGPLNGPQVTLNYQKP